MGFDSPSHWLILAIVVAVLFGYKKLPEVTRSVGRSLRIFKTEMKGMTDDDAARDAADTQRVNGSDGSAAGQAPPAIPQVPPAIPQVPPAVPQVPPAVPQVPPAIPQVPPVPPQASPTVPPSVAVPPSPEASRPAEVSQRGTETQWSQPTADGSWDSTRG